LAVVLVVGIGYLLLQRGVLPLPPETTRPSPEVDGGIPGQRMVGEPALLVASNGQPGLVDPVARLATVPPRCRTDP